MQTVLIVVHLMIVIALVAVVLLQRSEGGALGVGGGSGFMTGRGQANVLTRATAILATLFFATSLSLTLLANYGKGNKSILEGVAPARTSQPAPTSVPPKGQGSVLDQLRKIEEQHTGGAPGRSPSTTPAPATPSTNTPSAAATAPVEPTGMPSAPANQAPSAPKPTATPPSVPPSK